MTNDKNLFQITYDVYGYSPGGYTANNVLYLPVPESNKLREIEDRFKILIDQTNEQNKKAIEKKPELKLEYFTVKGE